MTDFFSLDSYDYVLPEERIAQEPPKVRGQSCLMVLDKNGCEAPIHTQFTEIADFLPANALLIANNSRVVPARLAGHRPSGGKAEMLLMTPAPLLEKKAVPADAAWMASRVSGDVSASALDRVSGDVPASASGDVSGDFECGAGISEDIAEPPYHCAEAEVLLRPSKNIRIGDMLSFGGKIRAQVLRKGEFGQHDVRLFWSGDLVSCLEEAGKIPLPPYIKRPEGPNSNDLARYQTIYARQDQSGSVAAPTAGLHFTPEIRENLQKRGFGWAEVTLHVGYGTFSPVREDDIRQHPMHSEYVEIPAETAQAVLRAKAEGRPVIAVGTTSARSLEGMSHAFAEYLEGRGSGAFHLDNAADGGHAAILPSGGCFGQTNIFIYPGYKFRVLDGLITNFHLPKSSLLMLVCALAGHDAILSAYAEAVRQEYRFFSYGDAMLIR